MSIQPMMPRSRPNRRRPAAYVVGQAAAWLLVALLALALSFIGAALAYLVLSPWIS